MRLNGVRVTARVRFTVRGVGAMARLKGKGRV